MKTLQNAKNDRYFLTTLYSFGGHTIFAFLSKTLGSMQELSLTDKNGRDTLRVFDAFHCLVTFRQQMKVAGLFS